LLPAVGPGWCIQLVEQTLTVEGVCFTRSRKSRREHVTSKPERSDECHEFFESLVVGIYLDSLTRQAHCGPRCTSRKWSLQCAYRWSWSRPIHQPQTPLPLLMSIPTQASGYSPTTQTKSAS